MSDINDRVLNDHIFQTNLSADKFDAVCRRSCRAGFRISLDAADPTVVPPVRFFRVEFDAVEDRDRVRIAMRFVEKELAETVKEAPRKSAKPPAKAAPIAARLATA